MNANLFIALIGVGVIIFSMIFNLFIVKASTSKCKYVVQVDYDGAVKNHPGIAFVGYNDTDMKEFIRISSLNEKEAVEAVKKWEANPKQPKEGYCVTYKALDGTYSRVFWDKSYPYKGVEVGKWWWPIFGIKNDHCRLIYKNYGNNSAAYPGAAQDSQAPDKEFDVLENTHVNVNFVRTLKESTLPVIAILAFVGLIVLGVVAYRQLQPPTVIISQNQTATVTK